MHFSQSFWRQAKIGPGVLAVLTVTVLGPLGASASAAVAAPTITDLGTRGGTGSSAAAVSGDIVAGDADTASGDQYAFAYDLGAPRPSMIGLGILPGGTYSQAYGVSGGIVAGVADTARSAAAPRSRWG